jgi:hypothetical protein
MDGLTLFGLLAVRAGRGRLAVVAPRRSLSEQAMWPVRRLIDLFKTEFRLRCKTTLCYTAD